jgi:hypothetical protein
MSAALRRLLAAGARAALRSHTVERAGAMELQAAALDRPCASLAGTKRFSTLVNVVRLPMACQPVSLPPCFRRLRVERAVSVG